MQSSASRTDFLSPSSRGLGHHPFTVSTGVRIPLGTPDRLIQPTKKPPGHSAAFLFFVVLQRLSFGVSLMSLSVQHPPSMAIFCKVVDNYGDIGICWRLARQLQREHGVAVILWVDDLISFRRICPASWFGAGPRWHRTRAPRHGVPWASNDARYPKKPAFSPV